MIAQLVEKQYKVFIDGQLTDSINGETFEVYNPTTEKVLAKVPLCTDVDVDKAIHVANKAFKSFKKTTPAERCNLLLKLAEIIEKNAEELAVLETLNVGKPIAESREDMEFAADLLRFFAGAARNLQGLSAGEYIPGHTSLVRREPIGVAASIAPWNFPLVTAVTLFAPAIAAGNTVVLKTSEVTPLTMLYLAELSKDIFPKGVFNILTGYGKDAGAALSKSRDVSIISLIGSVRSGVEVAKDASTTLKKVHLELGGKAPAIVYGDVDIDSTVEGIKIGAFSNCGQICTAATRIYVEDSIYEMFVNKLVQAVESIVIGDPLEENTQMGPLVSKAHLERVQSLVERAASQPHIHILTGGKALDKQGYFFAPTIVAGAKQTDEIIVDEVFGPVITVTPFASEEEVIHYANDCKYALASSVWTTNIDRAMSAMSELEFGTVWVNCHLPGASEMPHGGLKQSGYGKDQSIYSLEEYTEIKHVMIKS